MLSGVAAEWFGSRALLVFGLAMSGTGYLLFVLAGGAPLLVICLIVVGIGTAFQHAPASALVSAAYSDGGRRGALGLYNSSGDAGKLAFTMSFSLALGAGIAWSLVATAFGLVALVAAAIALAMLRRETPAVATYGTSATGWGILDRPAFAMLLGAVFLDSLVQASALTFVAFLMLDKGAPLSIATFAATAILVGGIFGKAAGGFLADRKPSGVMLRLSQMGLQLLMSSIMFSRFRVFGKMAAPGQDSPRVAIACADEVDPRWLARKCSCTFFATVPAGESGGGGPRWSVPAPGNRDAKARLSHRRQNPALATAEQG